MSRPKEEYELPKMYGYKSCIYKLYFNEKFIIVKAKDHVQSVNSIQKSLRQFLKGTEFQQNPNNLYFHFFSYVKEAVSGDFIVEIVKDSESQYELLKAEQLELEDAKNDTNCLNNNIDPYIPLYNEETDSYGWITKNSFLNYKKWLKSRQKSKQSQ